VSDAYRGMLIFLLLGVAPWVLILTWIVALYLTFLETREQKMDRLHTIWWLQLVFLTHFLGYVVLRAWVLYRRFRPA
jgi:hypothetical protein